MSFYPHLAHGAIVTSPEHATSPRAKRLAAEALARIAARVPTDWSAAPTPKKRCPTCRGSGVASWSGPHAGSCPTCRGFRVVEPTDAELRDAYREARRIACERLSTSPGAFDAAVAKALPDGAGAREWVAAALAILAKTEGPRKK